MFENVFGEQVFLGCLSVDTPCAEDKVLGITDGVSIPMVFIVSWRAQQNVIQMSISLQMLQQVITLRMRRHLNTQFQVLIDLETCQ